ncbi:oligosaccharide flippase family protein [Ideonella sp. A 288]|uniref:oligosaccharide flippase family protein n=1 Tax=Ideonella sp. A 288 TaxID=1962181 RepID=UPI0013035026|nr:oligosaccharide flippase family protein [Ideonella sp. A 288]
MNLALQIASTVVISRILTPAETGVFAVAAVFAALASNFRDFGVGEYLIQETNLTSDKIRAALTLNIAISWTMGLVLFTCSEWAAGFYRTAGVGEVMRVQAVNFLLIPFGAVTMAYFRRELNFKPIFIVGLVANVGSFAVSIICALRGMGYMSLAWSSLAGVALTVLMSVWFRPRDFPRWPGLRGVAEVFHFGKFASGVYFLGQLGKGAPEMIIGRAQNMAAVAIFSRATGLVEIFNRLVLRAVLPVCMPYFAKSNREDGSLVKGYLTSISYLTAIGWPFIAFLGVIAFAAIRLVYGPQWVEAAPLAKIACAAAAVDLVHHLAKEALLAIGKAKTSNNLQAGIVSAQIIGLLAVVPFGLPGAAWGFLGATVVSAVLSQWVLHRSIGLRLVDVARNCLPSVYITVLTVAPVAVWSAVEGITENNFARFVFGGGAITAAGWILSLKLLGHPLWREVVKVGALMHASAGALIRR